jgi:uncharacterized RDD family membrane protein YckC
MEVKVNKAILEKSKASSGKRFVNYIVDYIVQLVLFIGIMMVIVLLQLYLTGSNSIGVWFDSISKVEEYLFGYVMLLVYYFSMESLAKGKTVGKLITNTKVVNLSGETPNVGNILKRTLCRMIPFNALSFLGNEARGWHDSISATYVVDIKTYELEKQKHFALEEIGLEN